MSRSKLKKMSKLKSYSFIPAGGFPSFMKKKENKKPASDDIVHLADGLSFLQERNKEFYSLYSFVLESVSTILSFIL